MVLEGSNLFGRAADEGKREEVLSIPPHAFSTSDPSAHSIKYSTAHALNSDVGGWTVSLFAPIFLPDGATIISATAFGDAGLEASSLWIIAANEMRTGTATALAGAGINDQGFYNKQLGVVDNERYNYVLVALTSASLQNEKFYGAKIRFKRK